MISLEQIRLLEARIDKAVEMIKRLKAENSSLRSTLDSAQSRMQDLETRVKDLRVDQEEIEQSILRAINSLDELEDEVSEAYEADTPATKAGSSPKPAAGTKTEGKPGAAGGEPEGDEDSEPSRGDADSEGAGTTGEPAEPSGDEARELDIF